MKTHKLLNKITIVKGQNSSSMESLGCVCVDGVWVCGVWCVCLGGGYGREVNFFLYHAHNYVY